MNEQLKALAGRGTSISTKAHPWRISDGNAYKFFSDRWIATASLLHLGWERLDVLGSDGQWLSVDWRSNEMAGR